MFCQYHQNAQIVTVEVEDMSIQKIGRIKKTIVLLMVVGFILSVTAATVSAGNGGIYTGADLM